MANNNSPGSRRLAVRLFRVLIPSWSAAIVGLLVEATMFALHWPLLAHAAIAVLTHGLLALVARCHRRRCP